MTTIRPTLTRVTENCLLSGSSPAVQKTVPVRALLKATLSQRLLQEEPTLEDRHRFRLRRASVHADYELRVEEWRVFHRVQEQRVVVELIGRKDGNRLIIEGQEFGL